MSIELVSFDWDYCVPIHAGNDWGHDETMMFFETIWNARIGVFKKVDGVVTQMDMGDLLPEVNFPRVFTPFRFGIGESHVQALEHFIYTIEAALEKGQAVDQMDWVIHHYDLHHDMWGLVTDKNPDSPEIVLAENWLHNFVRWLRLKFVKRNITIKWHTPYWFEEQGYDVEAYGWSKYKKYAEDLYDIKMEHVQDMKDLGHLRPIAVFVCRSGCWTPPHLDPYFSTMCRDIMNLIGEESNRSNIMPVRVYKAHNEKVDPLVPRPFSYIALDALEQLKIATEEFNKK